MKERKGLPTKGLDDWAAAISCSQHDVIPHDPIK